MVGFLRVSEGAASLTSRPCLLVMPLGVSVGGSAGSTGASPPPGHQLLAGQQGREEQPAGKWSLGYSRLLKGPSRAGAPLTGSQDLQSHWNSFHQKQDQERGEVHQLLSLASGCYRTHPAQPPLLLPRLPVHQGGSKLPSSLKHQKL